MTKTGTKVNGYDLYSYTSTNFLTNWEKVIFSNGSSSQTADLTITSNCFNASGATSVYTPSGSGSGTGTGTGTGTQTNNNNAIYFINTKNWSNVYLYAWKGNGGSGNQLSNWPGVKMTKTSEKVNGYYVWKYESTGILTNWEKVIFSNGGSSQTADLTITTNCYNGSGTASTYTPSSSNNQTNNNVIYFINTKNWSNVYVYAWKGNGGSGNQLSSWPGVKMTKTSQKVNGYYVWKLESTGILTNWEKVIFSNGGSSQTADLTITTNCYNGSGTASTYNG